VWVVGGAASSSTAVNNGRGSLVRSGTNARLFTISFSDVKPRTEYDLDKHEARIASALDLNRVQRVLECTVLSPSSGRNHPTETATWARKQRKTFWNGNQWIREELVLSEITSCSIFPVGC
jgi:hypothetical protein